MPVASGSFTIERGQLNFSDAIPGALQSRFTSRANTGWVLVGYADKSGRNLALEGSGAGSVDELAPLLRDDACQYALVRVELARDDSQGTSMGAKYRDVFVTSIGAKVGVLEKGKKKSHIGDVMSILKPSHVTLTVLNRSNFTLSTVVSLCEGQAASGHVIS